MKLADNMINRANSCYFLLICFCMYKIGEAQVPFTGDWERLEYDKFVETGSAYRIVNTLCGQLLLLKPMNRTDGETFPDWRNHTARNNILCECARRGHPAFKFAWFVFLRAWTHGHHTYAKGKDLHDAIVANKTIHILVHHERLPTYYEYWNNGELHYDFTTNLTKTQHERNQTAVFQEEFFSYVLRKMVASRLSFTFVDPSRSFWEKETVNDKGVLGIITDSSILPKNGNRTYYDAWPAFNFFKDVGYDLSLS